MKQLLLVLVCLFFGQMSRSEQMASPREGFDWAPLEVLAVQDGGRIKPLAGYADQSVRFVTGKRKFQGISSIEILFSWMWAYEQLWYRYPFIRIDHIPLKEHMGVSATQTFFSPKEIEDNAALIILARQALQRKRHQELLSVLDKKVMELDGRLGLVDAIVRGRAPAMVPNPNGAAERWLSLAELSRSEKYSEIYPAEKKDKFRDYVNDLRGAYANSKAPEWNSTVGKFAAYVATELSSAGYPAQASLEREVHYNNLRPFRLAWVIYLIALIFNVAFLVTQKPTLRLVGSLGLWLGFLIHTYGFVLRCWIAGRPPVTNMYESVVWASWGCILLALIIGGLYRKTIILSAAMVFSIVSLVLADNLPSVLDPSIQPLTPVLRSSFWLTTHVLSITLSYGAFALSLCLGNVVLTYYIFQPQKVETIQQLSFYNYRAVQIGVVLLAVGTILGGVWADYSWGRFWGWDPKEVWALICLLLYLAVLHGRFTRWLRGFGFVAATVVCFLSILMAWYGVNFVLGAGLHSYGFGTGGTGYVLTYAVLQFAYILVAYLRGGSLSNVSKASG